jgi:hypothetical protein
MCISLRVGAIVATYRFQLPYFNACWPTQGGLFVRFMIVAIADKLNLTPGTTGLPSAHSPNRSSP